MRILVAEDEAALASLIKKGVESEHYAVDVSSDGAQVRAMAGDVVHLCFHDEVSSLFRAVG